MRLAEQSQLETYLMMLPMCIMQIMKQLVVYSSANVPEQIKPVGV